MNSGSGKYCSTSSAMQSNLQKDGGSISFVAENDPGNDEQHMIVRYRISDMRNRYERGVPEQNLMRSVRKMMEQEPVIKEPDWEWRLPQHVDLMGGKIEVSRQGIGSTFTVKSSAYSRTGTTEANEKLRKDMDLHGLHVLLAETMI